MSDYVAVWKNGFWNAVPRDQVCNCAAAPLTPAKAMERCEAVAELVEAAKYARYEARIYADLLFRLERALAPFTKP